MVGVADMTRRLETVFERRQANVLATVITDAYTQLVKTGDFNELKGIVRDLAQAQRELAQAQQRTELRVEELAQAQQRTELRVEELAQAQQRTELRVEELAQAQQRTELRMEELAQAQRELTQAQQRTEEAVRTLAVGLQETRSEVGGLSRSMSYALENEAYRALPAFLQGRYGLALTERLVRTEVGGEEVNFLGRARRNGQQVLIVGETKLRLDERRAAGRAAESVLETLARKVAAVQQAHPNETILPLLVTHFARPAFLREAEAKGVIVVQSFEW
jgi:hypothetical protein